MHEFIERRERREGDIATLIDCDNEGDNRGCSIPCRRRPAMTIKHMSASVGQRIDWSSVSFRRKAAASVTAAFDPFVPLETLAIVLRAVGVSFGSRYAYEAPATRRY